MKRLNPLWLFILLMAFVSCKVSRNVVYDETGSRSVEFTPVSVVAELNEGLALEVTPMDASELNIYTYFYSLLDGKFFFDYSESQMMSYYMNKKAEENRGKKIAAHRKQIRNYLAGRPEVTNEILEDLMFKIEKKDVGVDGNSASKSSKWDIGQTKNPYFSKGKYHSLFKLKFTNSGSKNATVELDKLLVQNGYEQLYPFKKEDMIDNLENDDKKENLHRLNLPETMVIPAGATIVKIVATPPINTKKSLKVEYIVEDQTVPFEFTVKTNAEKKTRILEEFRFGAKNVDIDFSRYYTVVLHKNELKILRGNRLFVQQEELDSKFSVFSVVGIPEGFRYGYLKDAVFSDYKDGRVFLEYESKQKYLD